MPIDPLSLVMIAAIVVLVFFMFRNGKKRKEQQEEMRNNMVPGTDIMLQSGIYGEIVSVDTEANRAVIQSGTSTLEVHIGAIGMIVPAETAAAAPAETSSDIAPDDDPEFGERVKEMNQRDTTAEAQAEPPSDLGVDDPDLDRDGGNTPNPR